MILNFQCPECGAESEAADIERLDAVACACGYQRPIRRESFADGRVRACPWCATPELFVQKDFPRWLGLTILAIGFGVSSVFWYYYMPTWSLLVLVGTAVADGILYRVVPDVLTCYRCQCELRGGVARDTERFQAFDLEVGERYRQERLRIREIGKDRTPL